MNIINRLAFFEREFQFYNTYDFIEAVQSHYVGQIVKQAYVVILGFDVLGNPFGFARGFLCGLLYII